MKKKIIILFIFLILIFALIGCYFLFNMKHVKEENSKEQSGSFRINKIKYYSSCNAVPNTTNYQNPEWNVKVYQYTDIAIYLDRITEPSNENYITNLSLKNFKLLDNEEIYYLNPLMFGNNDLNSDELISDDNKLEYNVINSSNENSEQNYNIPIFFQDCSNPITLRFVNNLSDNYKVSSDDTLTYNGSLLNKLGVNPEKLNTTFSFDIEIITKDGNKINKNIELNIPLSDKEQSILEGDFEIEVNEEIEL